jgi:hypothetical protein
LLRGGPGTTKDEKKRKKMKKNEKNSVFYVFGFFKNGLKISHFGGLRASLGEEGREPPKREKNRKKNEKKHENQMKKNDEKNGKKKQKKLEVFYVLWIFQKWAKNRPFWWPPCLSEGKAGNPPKWKLWGAFPYKNLCKGNFGAARSSNMESLGNLSNFGDDFGDVFGDK